MSNHALDPDPDPGNVALAIMAMVTTLLFLGLLLSILGY